MRKLFGCSADCVCSESVAHKICKAVILRYAYSCDHKFKHNHYGYECYDNFRAFTDFFELFFLQGGLIIQQTSLMTSRKQEFGATIWNSIWCSPIHTESNVNTPHNKIKCPSCGQIFSQNCSTSLVKVTKSIWTSICVLLGVYIYFEPVWIRENQTCAPNFYFLKLLKIKEQFKEIIKSSNERISNVWPQLYTKCSIYSVRNFIYLTGSDCHFEKTDSKLVQAAGLLIISVPPAADAQERK